jgi:hypothetical protein
MLIHPDPLIKEETLREREKKEGSKMNDNT